MPGITDSGHGDYTDNNCWGQTRYQQLNVYQIRTGISRLIRLRAMPLWRLPPNPGEDSAMPGITGLRGPLDGMSILTPTHP